MIRLDDDLDPLPSLEIEEVAPRTLLVRVRGELDDEATAQLRAALDRELAELPVSLLLVDLSRVTLLGSAALGLLLELHRRCRTEDRHLVLIGTGCPAVNRPLRVSGLLPLFDTRHTVAAALHRPHVARVRGDQPPRAARGDPTDPFSQPMTYAPTNPPSAPKLLTSAIEAPATFCGSSSGISAK
jgi:anti-anti-sigma factor